MTQINDLCSVCGMKTEAEIPSVEHHKMYFHFCSEQCRETFVAHPGLFITQAGKEQSAILKRRTMRLAEPLDNDATALLIPSLMEMMGVKEVVVEGDKLHITYDLMQVTEMQIEKTLVEVGVQLGGGWLELLCRAWVHNSEETELDSLAAPTAPCFNRPPPRI